MTSLVVFDERVVAYGMGVLCGTCVFVSTNSTKAAHSTCSSGKWVRGYFALLVVYKGRTVKTSLVSFIGCSFLLDIRVHRERWISQAV